MEDNIINQVIVLALIMFIGLYSRKKDYINDETIKNLSTLLMNVILPCLIISSFEFKFSSEMLSKVESVFIYSFVIHMFLILFSNIFFYKYNEERKNVLRFITIFSNFGFMGYPIIEGIYGKTGVLYASVFGIPFNIISFTYGVMLFAGKKEIKSVKNIILQPAIISVFLGMLMFVFSIKLPMALSKTASMVGAMTTPLSMIIVGAMFAKANVLEILADRSIYYISIIRLIIVPVSIYYLFKIFNIGGMIANMCVILEAMPAAAITAVFAERYDVDKVFTSKCIFVTTILSIITIPIVVVLTK